MSYPSTYGSGKGKFNRHAFPIDSLPKRCQGNLLDSRPFGKCLSLASMCKKNIVPLVMRLFQKGRPDAVFWTVITVIIFSFYGQIVSIGFPHIVSKVFKSTPAFANFDSASSVMPIIPSTFAQATLYDSTPNIVHASSGSTVSSQSRGLYFIFVASTAYGFLCAQVTSRDFSLYSTSALTQPRCFIGNVFLGSAQYSPASKCFAAEINKSRHDRILGIIKHLSTVSGMEVLH